VSNLAHTVKRTVLLDAAPLEVWEALTDETLLSEWLAPEVELDPREGGELVCRFEDGEERRGEVALVEEAERLAFDWHRAEGPSRVEWTLAPTPDGTRFTVTETATVPAGTRRRDDLDGMLDGIGPSTPTALAAGLTGGWGPPLGRLRRALRLVLA
jgi:uncharacterized protein YndB with AHSA1/START domain